MLNGYWMMKMNKNINQTINKIFEDILLKYKSKIEIDINKKRNWDFLNIFLDYNEDLKKTLKQSAINRIKNCENNVGKAGFKWEYKCSACQRDIEVYNLKESEING